MAEINTPSLSPDSSASDSFVLSTKEWLSIKTFVASALMLPTSPALLRASLPANPTGGIDQFKDLTDSYQTLQNTCSNFNTYILPNMVKCASDLVTYNNNLIPPFYDAIKTILRSSNPYSSDATKIENLTELCYFFSSKVESFVNSTISVLNAMQKFSTEIAPSEYFILQQYNKYNEQIVSKNGDIQSIQSEFIAVKNDLSDAEEEYKQDVIVAATTACYAWIWPCGTIAAGIVAGKYGDKSTKAKAKMDTLKGSISDMDTQLAADTTLIIDLTRIAGDIKGITDKIYAALTTIQQILGVWNVWKVYVENIPSIIESNKQNLYSLIAELRIDETIATWQTVSNEANNYFTNAYITVSSDMDIVIKAADDLEAIKNK
ncbi:MAG: alpha-xenorhabdolysin family binary toxin subunit A [Pyrinomonadaceae bacterium]|nr:alpha-xenorhabdolysin family binary toxin subunit A [Sphingobacteriaceae bacterium]